MVVYNNRHITWDLVVRDHSLSLRQPGIYVALKRTRQEAGGHFRGAAGGHSLQEIGAPECEAPMSES